MWNTFYHSKTFFLSIRMSLFWVVSKCQLFPISATPGQASWWRDCSLASQWQGVLESHHTTAEQKEFIQWLKHPSFAVKKAMWPLKRDMLNYFPIFFHCITGLIISSLGPPSTRRKEGDRSCERALEGKQHVAGHGLGGLEFLRSIGVCFYRRRRCCCCWWWCFAPKGGGVHIYLKALEGPLEGSILGPSFLVDFDVNFKEPGNVKLSALCIDKIWSAERYLYWCPKVISSARNENLMMNLPPKIT